MMIKDSVLSRNLPHHATAPLIPALIAAVFIIILAVILPQALFSSLLGLIVAYLLPPAGKETVIRSG